MGQQLTVTLSEALYALCFVNRGLWTRRSASVRVLHQAGATYKAAPKMARSTALAASAEAAYCREGGQPSARWWKRRGQLGAP